MKMQKVKIVKVANDNTKERNKFFGKCQKLRANFAWES